MRRTRAYVDALRAGGRRHALLAVAAVAVASVAGTVAIGSGAATGGRCDVSVTPETFAGAVDAAFDGETLCLASGDYGTWHGTDKPLTIAAAAGSAPRMRLDLGSESGGFTLDGMTGMSGEIALGARDLTIRDSTFAGTIEIEAVDAGIVLDHDRFDWPAVYGDGSPNAKVFIYNDAGDFSGVTVENSTISHGDLDGVHLGAGADVIGNSFSDLCDLGTNHTDNIQFEGGDGGRIARNYIFAPAGCATQGITSYDGGTVGVTIEDNVVDIRRPWGIELYSDKNSVVRHNTLRWYRSRDCEFKIVCGQIDIDRKDADPPGSGTRVYDNIATDVGFANGSTGVARGNLSGERARFVGPLTGFAGFRLAADSPVDVGAASDGLDAGVRYMGS